MVTSLSYNAVNEHYSRLARETALSHDHHSQQAALSFGYSANDLSTIPEGSNLGVSCGNPIALAGLKEGETVVDLGSGAGFDVFLAACKVGPSGLAIGVDMSKDMLSRARLNASKSGITNVKFVESMITKIDLPTSTSDCIISNCVINLVPELEKHLVFQEIFRLLKPGGRVAISDILARKAFPPNLQTNLALYVGCISGASLVEEYEKYLNDAGFADILVVDKKINLNVYKDGCDLLNDEEIEYGKGSSDIKAGASDIKQPSCCGSRNAPNLKGSCNGDEQQNLKAVADVDFNEWVGSFDIYAVKAN